MLNLEVLDDLATLQRIRSEWSVFSHSLPYLTPTQTPSWILTWWRHFGSGKLRVYSFRDQTGALVGLIPTFNHIWQNQRQLTLIGSGITDYLEPAISRAHSGMVVQYFADCLVRQDDWDVCDWQDLDKDTQLITLSSDSRFIAQIEPDAPCSEIRIEATFEEFWAARSSGLRRNVRRYRQKAEQTAPLETNVSEGLDEESLDALIRLHTLRWREQGEPGMIAANRSAAFLRDLAREFATEKRLLFFTLRYGRQIAAVILAFPHLDVLYAYLSGFDPAYASFGFGSVLLHDALRYTFERRFRAWNFLRGKEAYKFDWGAQLLPKSRLVIRRPTQRFAGRDRDTL